MSPEPMFLPLAPIDRKVEHARGWCNDFRELDGPPVTLTDDPAPFIFCTLWENDPRQLGIGVMATRLTLDQVIGVRLPDPQPNALVEYGEGVSLESPSCTSCMLSPHDPEPLSCDQNLSILH